MTRTEAKDFYSQVAKSFEVQYFAQLSEEAPVKTFAEGKVWGPLRRLAIALPVTHVVSGKTLMMVFIFDSGSLFTTLFF